MKIAKLISQYICANIIQYVFAFSGTLLHTPSGVHVNYTCAYTLTLVIHLKHYFINFHNEIAKTNVYVYRCYEYVDQYICAKT